MRINVYSEELTDRVEKVSKVVDGQTFYGVRFYLKGPPELENTVGEGIPALTIWGATEDGLLHILDIARGVAGF